MSVSTAISLLAVIGVLVGLIYSGLLALRFVTNLFRYGVFGVLGRLFKQQKASIPDVLTRLASPFPLRDIEREALLRYDPQPHSISPPPPVHFKSDAARYFRDEEPWSTTANVDSISDILAMSPSPTYEPLFGLPHVDTFYYPFSKPSSPPPIPAPPSWTLWNMTFPEPTFTPPYYSGRLTFLNRYVDAVYQSEKNRVAAALRRRDEYLSEMARRNNEVAALLVEAESRYYMAHKAQEALYDKVLEQYDADANSYIEVATDEQEYIRQWANKINVTGAAGFTARFQLTMLTIGWPGYVSIEGQSSFNQESGILIHEHRFPDLSSLQWRKTAQTKSGQTSKPLGQRELRESSSKIYPAMCLRLAAEAAKLDSEGILKAVAINGWADYTEKATGQRKRAYCASLYATKAEIERLNLSALDPVAAFRALKGITAPSLELTPIAPILKLNTDDPRFVDGKEVLANMSAGDNLATMDWEDFEHLCRELFERAFSATGADVKVTQASRDQGVDAIIFDPDPLRGGKIVIQAKRYTNTVDVSAVRDLFGTVHNEGALKGILVTTSHYGPDSYAFAKDKPLTLINGHELLGLLEQHGYKFRIDLTEAKSLM